MKIAQFIIFALTAKLNLKDMVNITKEEYETLFVKYSSLLEIYTSNLIELNELRLFKKDMKEILDKYG